MRCVEVLYFASCPGWRAAVDRVRQVLAEGGLEDTVSIRMVAVETEEQAERLRFPGSPTVRVDGHDVQPPAGGGAEGTLQCRLYEHEGRLEKVPSADRIRAALGVRPDALESDDDHQPPGDR